MPDQYFLKMIETLRLKEEIMLYGNILSSTIEEDSLVKKILEKEYEREITGYPFISPDFDAEAALYGARTIYLSAQLLLYRQNKPADLVSLFPAYANEITVSSIVSCDLCLRFLPDLVRQLFMIDSEDPLIVLLEEILMQWKYSAVSYQQKGDPLDLDKYADPCIQQLYINRIIEFKNKYLGGHAVLKGLVFANLGMFAEEYWKELEK